MRFSPHRSAFYRENIRPSFTGYAANKADEAALAAGLSRLRPVPGMNGGHIILNFGLYRRFADIFEVSRAE